MPETIKLSLKQGNILGEKQILRTGRSYYKFFGIPYAKPPINELRFRGPQILEKFTENPLDCRTERSMSLQTQLSDEQIIGSEDCLYLNVHAPCINGDKKLPVLVWIHGGGFLTGRGNKYICYPQYILEADVILVTVNYRLGMFGFLSFPSGGISGNYGLKDQLMALKWIHENIHSFNGDPNNVTLMGHSAGAGCVHFHLLSSASRKYFHRLINHSGSSINQWSVEDDPDSKALRLAKHFDFKGTPQEIADSFRNLENPTDSLKYVFNILNADEKRRVFVLPFRPVIESDDTDEEPFITKHPLELMKTRNLFDIPVMSGYTSKEGIMVLAFYSHGLQTIEKDLGCVLPVKMCSDLNNPDAVRMAEKIRHFYFNNQQINKNNQSELCELLGDISFVLHFYWTAELQLEHQPQAPLYLFKFSYDSNLNGYKKRYGFDHVRGACHGDELYYLFYPNSNSNNGISNADDLIFIQKFCKLWTNFVKFNDPTPSCDGNKDDLIDFKWTPTNNVKNENNNGFILDVLDMNKKFEIVQNPDENRIEFWKKLAKDYNTDMFKL